MFRRAFLSDLGQDFATSLAVGLVTAYVSGDFALGGGVGAALAVAGTCVRAAAAIVLPKLVRARDVELED